MGGLKQEEPVRLLVFHYHDRPGGVREVIGRGLPLLMERLDGVGEVVFLMGELRDAGWREALSGRLKKQSPSVTVRWVEDREWGYAHQGFRSLSADSVQRLRDWLHPSQTLRQAVLWAHNLSVGRNIPLLRALPRLCEDAGAELWLHHHDWWWDGRWQRWRDWRAAEVASLEEALAATVPVGPHLKHYAINLADLPFLQAAAGEAARWVGNPLPAFRPPEEAEVGEARRWLAARTGERPVWLAPVRALRRKNLAEALLLTRRLAPDTCLVTTGGSSAEEAAGWNRLRTAAAAQGWPLVPQVLAGMETAAPSVPALMAASEAVVITSLQEGFGLPWLEAAALGKPVVSRHLPDAADNLAALGCRLPGAYHSLPVPAEGFYNALTEKARVRDRMSRLADLLPGNLWARDGPSELAGKTGNAELDFGCLTQEAQLEVLAAEGQGVPMPPELQPELLCWPDGYRHERWAERFFASPQAISFPAAGHSWTPGAPAEVRRRLAWWLRHPLLWP
ncbi:MAG: glycosyltransferase, family [Verrucomicrobiales bacterium]|nr:glycosyltransferase, family [Verrucomicrobiales bacterium]